jgi:creatinase
MGNPMTEDMLHVMEWHNGDKDFSPFSDAEMKRRQDDVRGWMAANNVDAALFTSYHCINYYSGWLYCYFGRKYGMVIDQDKATTISAGIDGGQPWRRSFGDNITYTDWRRDNFYRAVRQLTPGVKRLGIEFDHVNLDFRNAARSGAAGRRVCRHRPALDVDALDQVGRGAQADPRGARICDVGGGPWRVRVKAGVPEHEVAIASTNAMIREIAKSFPFVELMDTWTWFQSGINTDGAHNPVTNAQDQSGDILSLNCFPMIFGYYTALERTLFCDTRRRRHLDIWEKNVRRPPPRAGADQARQARARKTSPSSSTRSTSANQWDLLKYRSFGYGHSFGVLCHYYGREAGVELREDIDTVLLKPGMVVSMEPMIMIPEGHARRRRLPRARHPHHHRNGRREHHRLPLRPR